MKTNECLSPSRLNKLVTLTVWKINIQPTFILIKATIQQQCNIVIMWKDKPRTDN